MAYIYEIINDINDKRYIGKTEFSIEKRFSEHCQDAFKDITANRPLYRAMRKYGVSHFHIQVIEETDFPEEREIYWINKKDTYHNGYNASLGGEGRRTIDYEAVVDLYQKIQNQNEVARQLNISSDAVHDILIAKHIPIQKGSDVIAKKNAKPVVMLDKKTKTVLKSFPSAMAAAHYLVDNHFTNCKLTTIRYHITSVCKGTRQTAGGFRWKFQ